MFSFMSEWSEKDKLCVHERAGYKVVVIPSRKRDDFVLVYVAKPDGSIMEDCEREGYPYLIWITSLEPKYSIFGKRKQIGLIHALFAAKKYIDKILNDASKREQRVRRNKRKS